MNGLKYIRNRCNLSLNDLASALGVTRQALSLWETEKKPIPPQRKKQLADFFGIDENYFGCITENEKKELLEKAMFRYVENGKETYRYKPKNASLTGEVICFPGDTDVTLDEQYVATQKRRQTTLEKSDEIIRYYDKGGDIQSQIACLNRGCNIYDSVNTLMDKILVQKATHRMAYYLEIYHVLEALLLAHDLETQTDILQKNHIYSGTIYDGSDYILALARQFRAHWQAQADKLDISLSGKGVTPTSAAEITSPLQEPSLSVREQIQQMESENRAFWEEHPEMKGQNGMSFHT